MKTNEELLKDHECINSDEDVMILMAKAQAEALKELVKRSMYFTNVTPPYNKKDSLKSTRDIALELIKEIEGK